MRYLLKTSISVLIISFIINGLSYAQDWHEEFDSICSKVETGDTLSVEEIRSLIERSEVLLKKIETIDDPSKKVYIFRLKKCKEFFEYLVELKKSTSDKSAP